MSDPVAERLSRFTPDASGLDREALLFAAGRASVPRDRRWMAVAGALAASQLLTLVFVWHRPASVVTAPTSPPLVIADPAPLVAPAPFADREGPNPWALRDQALAAEGNLPAPPAIEQLAPDHAPLHAFTAPPTALLE